MKKITAEEKVKIEGMSLNQLMGKFRFFPCGEYSGEKGKYLQKVLKDRASEINEFKNPKQSKHNQKAPRRVK